MDKFKLPFPECLALFGIVGVVGGTVGYAINLQAMQYLLPLCSAFSFLGFFFFHAKRYSIRYPERIGFWGFCGFLGFLGFVPSLHFLTGLFGLFGFFFFFAFFARSLKRRIS